MTIQQPEAASTVDPSRTTMRAVIHTEYAEADRLCIGTVDRPTTDDDGVLVRVHAAGVDRGVWHVMAGLPYPVRLAGYGLRSPKSGRLGLDVAGVVESVGGNVTAFRPGDEVFGFGAGTFAEYAVCRPDKLALKPPSLSFEQTAAMPVSGLTALQAVRDHARIERGQRMLILGASGGVGSFAVQIAKALGAEVTGVSSTAKAELVRSLGADRVIDYSTTDPTGLGERYDAILDIGGNTPLGKLRGVLERRGRLVIVGGETSGRWLGGTDRQLRAMALSPWVGQRLGTFIASENAADLAVLAQMVAAGQLKPAIDRVYPLDEAAAAIQHVKDGRARGKVVLSVSKGTPTA